MCDSALRHLPPVHKLLARPELLALETRHGRKAVRAAARAVLDEVRLAISSGETPSIDSESLAHRTASRLQAIRPQLRRVINATGILLHTGLGRAPLAPEAISAVVEATRGYCNLEFDLETGERGRRTAGVSELLCELTGAEAATVVNNNAAATVLTLRALAAGREVIVSRGQLVEIGGSYRLPEVFEVSGARLREVGTTNKTRLSDYAGSICLETAALLRVHASNFKVVGFTESVEIADLAALARSRGLLCIDDVGSGALSLGLPPGISGEPTIAESLAAGADLVLASGDKLLGGPQCGLITGRKEVVNQLLADPLMRAFRVDKMTLAALEATLRLALDHTLAARQIPLWASLSASLDELQARGHLLARALMRFRLQARPVESTAQVGGGSVPVESIPSVSVRVCPPFPPPILSETHFAHALRIGDPAIVARLREGSLWFDLRTLRNEDEAGFLAGIGKLLDPCQPSLHQG